MIVDGLVELKALAGTCADASTWTLSDTSLVDCLDAVHAAEQALAAVKLHLVRDIERRGLPVAQHASSTAVWLREHLRISIHAAKRLVDLAQAVDERPALDQALASGAVNVEQAAVVAAAVRDLPAGLGAGLIDRAEAALIAEADKCEPTVLRKVGEQVLAYVAPEVAEAADLAALERMEARVCQMRAFQLTRNGDGRVRLTGWLDEDGAATVNAALDPLCVPRHDDEELRTPAQRRADALV